MAQKFEFYFDFSSPYAYLASERVDAIAAKHGMQVIWRPFLLGAVFKLTNTAPLIGQPLKGDYSLHDLKRTARRYGFPFALPDQFPFGSVTASRAFYHIEQTNPAGAVRFAKAVFRASFAARRDMCPVESVVAVAIEQGFDGDDVMAGIQSAGIKAHLKQEVDRAIARHVFGAPFFFIDDEPFWGHDRLTDIDCWLDQGGW